MSQEGGPERTQRTVAELLAKYGDNSGESAPRRRRRRADDVSDTAPQAIIERVMSDSGTMLPVREDQEPHERVSHRQSRSGQPPQKPPPPPQKPPRARRPAPEPEFPPPPEPPVRPPPRPPVAGARRAEPEPMTEQLPRVAEPPTDPLIPDPAEPPAGLAEPPAGLGGTARRAPLLPRRSPGTSRRPGQPPPAQRPPGPQQASQPLPTPQPGQASGARPFPPVRQPGEFPGDSSETAIDPQAPPPEFLDEYEGYDDKAATRFEGYRAHDDLADVGERRESTAYTDPAALLADDDDDDFDFTKDKRDRGYDDFDVDDQADDLDGDRNSPDDLDEDAPEGTATREWLTMAGQLALGVIGGAVVWLGFNWLWGFLPAAALIAALVVIVGLVLLVRKIRRAEDLQTTVLAVLVGLVVTVSPAVLLLLGR